MTSFFSERTAEYSILPPLVGHLSERFGRAIPMYFWSNREANRTSERIHSDLSVSVLAVFARRPKLTKNADVLQGKLNRQLMEFSADASAYGIPCVAGFPAVRSLVDMCGGFRTYWFEVIPAVQDDIVFSVALSRPHLPPVLEGGPLLKALSLDEVADQVENIAVPRPWSAAIEVIEKTRVRSPHSGMYGAYGGNPYRPVYVVIPMSSGRS